MILLDDTTIYGHKFVKHMPMRKLTRTEKAGQKLKSPEDRLQQKKKKSGMLCHAIAYIAIPKKQTAFRNSSFLYSKSRKNSSELCCSL